MPEPSRKMWPGNVWSLRSPAEQQHLSYTWRLDDASRGLLSFSVSIPYTLNYLCRKFQPGENGNTYVRAPVSTGSVRQRLPQQVSQLWLRSRSKGVKKHVTIIGKSHDSVRGLSTACRACKFSDRGTAVLSCPPYAVGDQQSDTMANL